MQGWLSDARGDRQDPVGTHRLSDIPEALLAQILEQEISLAAYLPIHIIGNAHSTRFTQGLEARCHIHAIAIDIIPFDNHVSQIYAYSEDDLLVLGESLIG